MDFLSVSSDASLVWLVISICVSSLSQSVPTNSTRELGEDEEKEEEEEKSEKVESK